MPSQQKQPVASTPHDAVFQWILGQPEHAASQLRAVLPPKLVERLDLDRLELYLLLQTAPKNPHMLNELRRWLDDLAEVLRGPGGEKDFASLVMYILTASETPEEPLGDLFAELGPEAKRRS